VLLLSEWSDATTTCGGRGRAVPSGIPPSGMTPSGITPSGVGPSGITPSGITPSRSGGSALGRGLQERGTGEGGGVVGGVVRRSGHGGGRGGQGGGVGGDDDMLTPKGYPPTHTAADLAHSTHSTQPARGSLVRGVGGGGDSLDRGVGGGGGGGKGGGGGNTGAGNTGGGNTGGGGGGAGAGGPVARGSRGVGGDDGFTRHSQPVVHSKPLPNANDDLFTFDRLLFPPEQRGSSPQRHTAAGAAARTTTDAGNTVPQRANPTQTDHAHLERGGQAQGGGDGFTRGYDTGGSNIGGASWPCASLGVVYAAPSSSAALSLFVFLGQRLERAAAEAEEEEEVFRYI